MWDMQCNRSTGCQPWRRNRPNTRLCEYSQHLLTASLMTVLRTFALTSPTSMFLPRKFHWMDWLVDEVNDIQLKWNVEACVTNMLCLLNKATWSGWRNFSMPLEAADIGTSRDVTAWRGGWRSCLLVLSMVQDYGRLCFIDIICFYNFNARDSAIQQSSLWGRLFHNDFLFLLSERSHHSIGKSYMEMAS